MWYGQSFAYLEYIRKLKKLEFLCGDGMIWGKDAFEFEVGLFGYWLISEIERSGGGELQLGNGRNGIGWIWIGRGKNLDCDGFGVSIGARRGWGNNWTRNRTRTGTRTGQGQGRDHS